jgi:gliding motility-associated-like protein
VPILSSAQLCSGSLGDPVLNITFGTGHGKLAATATGFAYAGGCPGKSQYTLSNLIFGCGEDKTWLMLAGDHTRDLNGSFMLVNAQSDDGAITPAIVHRDTVRNLCNNINYVFSAWVTNALQTITCGGQAVPASLSFRATTLSGTELARFDTGDIPIEDEKIWKQFGLSFQLPQGESAAILTISTTKKSGCGQGFALDDITLRPCGPTLTAALNGSAAPTDICADATKIFRLKGAFAASLTNPAVQWQSSLDTGRTWIDIPFATSVDYSVSAQDSGVVLYRMVAAESANIRSPNCRFVSNVLYTRVHPVPAHQPPQNLLGCLGRDLLLPPKNPFADQNFWSGPNGYSSTLEKAVVPQISYADTGLYQQKQDFGFGCLNVDSFYVHVSPSTVITVPPVYSICEGKSVVLEASGQGTFSWQPSTGLSNAVIPNPLASPHDSMQYKVTVTNSYGCKDSALVAVNVFRNPEAFAGRDKTIVKGDTVTLDGSVKGTAIRLFWSPPAYISDNTAMAPTVFPPADTRYTLTAESTVGCGSAQATVTVKVYHDIYVPNGFSPNNDGKNDQFKIIAADGYQLVRLLLYNRWGQVVYSARDFSKGWDGKVNGIPQPEGTYIYFLQIRSTNGKVITKKGTVTIIR